MIYGPWEHQDQALSFARRFGLTVLGIAHIGGPNFHGGYLLKVRERTLN